MFARLALLLFTLLWSPSFVAVKAGLRHLSPLLFVAIRLVACALALVALVLLPRRSWRPLAGRAAALRGRRGAAERGRADGAACRAADRAGRPDRARAVPDAPVTAAFGVAFLRERLRAGQWLGLALGLAGVGLVVGRSALQGAARIEGLPAAFLGAIGLAAGTLYFGRFCRGVPLLCGAASPPSARGGWRRPGRTGPPRPPRWPGTRPWCPWAAWGCTPPCWSAAPPPA